MELNTIYTYSQLDIQLDRVAQEIYSRWAGVRDLVLISILKGGAWTGYQLVNRMYPAMREEGIVVGHVGFSSYGDGVQPGEVKLTYPLDLQPYHIYDSDVWLIDDIWHVGSTLRTAKKYVEQFDPHSVHTAVLVSRADPTSGEEHPDLWGVIYTGSCFLAGCGMGVDDGERLRHLPNLYEVNE